MREAASGPTLLVLRARGLADLLTAVPALRALRAYHPAHRIVLAAPAAIGEIVGLIDAVDELLPTAELDSFGWQSPPPEIAVNLHGPGPDSIRALQALHPARLITHSHPYCRNVAGPSWSEDVHDVQRWCQLLDHLGIWADPTDLDLPAPPTASPVPGAVVLHPGARFGALCWPPARYSAVARAVSALGHRVVVTGGPAEVRLARTVAEMANLPAESVLAGRGDLRELAAVVAGARLVVCADPGVGQLATAFRTPSVLLFGPVSPQCSGPPLERPWHVALWAGEPSDPFADDPAAGLLRIRPAEVAGVAAELLAPSVSRAASGL